tara:strand:+ start:6063 stop:8384 length:2322 start_codon:yes stop_codon:yes gene_type:complete
MNKKNEIIGIFLILISIFIFTALFSFNEFEEPTISPNIEISNRAGILGIYISHFFIKMFFGFSSYFIPTLGIFWGWIFLSKNFKKIYFQLSIHSFIAFLILSVTLGFIDLIFMTSLSGVYSFLVSSLLNDFLGIVGQSIFLIAIFLINIRIFFSLNFYKLIQKLIKIPNQFFQIKKNKSIKSHSLEINKGLYNLSDKVNNAIISDDKINSKDDTEDITKNINNNNQLNSNDVVESISKPIISEDRKNINDEKENDNPSFDYNIKEEVIENEIDYNKNIKKESKQKYKLPSSEFLTNPDESYPSVSDDELVEKADFLAKSLLTFGVEGNVVNISPGPVITLFEVEPAEGVRVNKFVQLSDDLARVMKAPRVRIIAPIPGKSSVGIEIPNENPSTVYMKTVVNSEKFISSKSNLTVALGKNTTGENFIIELDKLPHLLIAGTTGSGKSVCINTIISSLLYRSSPDEVRFILIDPKKLEMAAYRILDKHHLITNEDVDEHVITTPENAVLALKAAEKEMSRRYDILAESVVRNIAEYREKAKNNNDLETMPYIVLIIDELADLMLRAPKDVEQSIARLAQMARAVGIHLVLATQRPSVDVITGVIKANFPARIAFQVATKIDSRTIIDINGAEKLLGKGDMLFLPPGSSDPIRLHNSYVTLDEINKIVSHIRNQPISNEILLEGTKQSSLNDGELNDTENGQDELINDAIRLVITNQQGSISLLQRRFRIGYSRAARLIDQMEQIGIVGPFTGSKARQVLVDENYLQILDTDESTN